MRWSWRIGTIAGIDVYMHATFLLLILFILGLYWHQGRTLEGALAGTLFILVIFGCIVLHELGHALAARKYGIQTRDITLLPIGGWRASSACRTCPSRSFGWRLRGRP